jgi:hypothetical protein
MKKSAINPIPATHAANIAKVAILEIVFGWSMVITHYIG